MKNTKPNIISQFLKKNSLLKKIAFLLTLFIFASTAVQAQTISDGGNYTVGSGGYFPDLPTAISVLNADPVNHTGVIFSITDPIITITTQTISKSVTIQGAAENADGSPNTIVYLQSGQTGRHFRVTGGSTINVAFKGLAIIGPNATYTVNAGVGTPSPTGTATAGGGVESLGPSAYPGSISVENCVVAGCNTSALSGTSAHGGGLNFTCSSAANYTQSYLKGVIVSAYNTAGASGSGGGIYFAFGKNHIQTTSLLIKGNTAAAVGGGMFVGGVTNPATTLTCTADNHLVVDSNTASAGGGGIASDSFGDTINLTGAIITNNKAITTTVNVTSGGGGIAARSALFLNNCTITGNTTGYLGGGVYAVANMVLNNSTISNNRAGYDLNNNAWLATGDGGGVYANNNLILQGSITLQNDTAAGNGGGIYKSSIASTSISSSSDLILNINNNVARVGAGGGINTQQTANFSNAQTITVNNNIAKGNGGGIFITGASSALFLKNTTVFNNKSGYDITTNNWITTGSASGGGIFSSSALTLQNYLVVTNNEAFGANASNAGAGISQSGTVTATGLTDSLIATGNIAHNGNGGGIYTSQALDLSACNKINISNNITKGNGGGIYVNGDLSINNATILNNKAGYDVTSASPWQTSGDGGGIYTNGALTLQGTITCQNDTTGGNGGAIYKSATGAFTLLNGPVVDISNNAARTFSGGGIYTAAATILDPGTGSITINNNSAQTTGGGIFANQSLSLFNNTISNNKARTNGGGAYATTTLTLNNSTISSNRAGYDIINGVWLTTGDGGGVYVNGNLTLQGVVSFQNDTTAGNGGAIYKGTTASSSISSSSDLVLNVNNNVARNGSGGGIYTLINTNISNAQTVTVSNNIAKSNGGGISSTAGGLTLKNASILNNKAGYDVAAGGWITSGTANGGGIYLTTAFTPQGYLVANNNEAFGAANSTGGGGIYQSGTVDAAGLTDSLIINGNKARNGTGGGIYVGGTLNLSACNKVNILNNIAKGSGGGIYAASGLTLKNATVSNNKAAYDALTGKFIGTVATPSYRGGGVYVTGNQLTLTGSIIFKNDSVSGSGINPNNPGGGAIYTDRPLIADAALGLTSLLIDSCAVVNPTDGTVTNINSGIGGAIFVNSSGGVGGYLVLKGSPTVPITISNNFVSGSGGGIYSNAMANGTTLSYVTVINNKGMGFSGGGVVADVGTSNFLNMEHSIIMNNYAGSVGGGIFMSAGSSSTISNTQILENTAKNNAGGIYFTTSPLTLSKNVISNNKAGYDITNLATPWQTTGDGGAIYANNNLTLQDTIIFQNNMSAGNGGAIYKSATGLFDVSALNSLAIDTNTARNASGGGIYTAAIFTLRNRNGVSLSYNTAGTTGGAISATATLELDSLSILHNTATTLGGGVYAAAAFTSIANTFANNNAANGGAVYAAGTATITNNTFSQNTATGNGGALNANAATTTIFSTFNGNSAATSGSAIFLNNVTNKTFNGNIIYGNGSSIPEMNIAPAAANYNIIRDMNLGGSNKTVSAGSGSSIFASITSGDLATLANNGGPTQTLLIKKRGLAQNFIPLTAGITASLDQRNLARPVSCAYDAGAVELQQSESDSITATFTLKNPTNLCGSTPAYNLNNSILSTTYMRDTLYFMDAVHTIAIPKPAIISVSGNTNIYVQFVDSNYCTKDTSFLISIAPLPVTTITGSSTVCLLDTVTYATADVMSSCAWEIVGGTAAGHFTSDTNMQTAAVVWTSAGSAQLKVTYTNVDGCQNSTTSNILVNGLPEVAISDNSNEICQGDQEELTITLTNGNSSAWSVVLGVFVNNIETGTITTGFTNASETTKTIVVSPLVNTVYKIKSVTDGNGCVKNY